MFFKLILTFKWKLAQKFSNFLLNIINFDTALNFNQVDLPYPVWNRVNSEKPLKILKTGSSPLCDLKNPTIFKGRIFSPDYFILIYAIKSDLKVASEIQPIHYESNFL